MEFTSVRSANFATRQFLAYLLSFTLAGQPVLPAISAGLNVATSDTGITQTAGGVPVVNIAPPNAGGISHNTFQDFNVGQEGLILNNSARDQVQSQLGGTLQGNARLREGREAAGIINEVVSTNRSELKGYLEVAGKGASVMVANPYGITCDGCGFINTPSATLTTGKPVLGPDGGLQALEVTRGSVVLQGKGLDASQTDKLAIIARAAEIHASLNAKDLDLIVGANQVNADGPLIRLAGEGTRPVVAVDTGALGGMYTNRIHLVSGDSGVGVNLGNLNARQGDIRLDSSGKLTLTQASAQGNIQIAAPDVVLAGKQQAQKNITVQARDTLLHQGELAAQGDIHLYADSVVNQRGRITAGKDLVIQKEASGQANREIINSSGTLESLRGDMVLNTASLANQREWLEMDYNGRSWRYEEGTWHSPGSGLRPEVVAPAGTEDRFIGGVTSGLWVTRAAPPARILAGRDLTLTADTLHNRASEITAGHDIQLYGTTLNNLSWLSGTETFWQALTANGQNALNPLPFSNIDPFSESFYRRSDGEAFRGSIQAGNRLEGQFSDSINNITWRANAGDAGDSLPDAANLPSGTQLAAQRERLRQGDLASPLMGSALSADRLALNTAHFLNHGGLVSGQSQLSLNSTDSVVNRASGVLHSEGSLSLSAENNIEQHSGLTAGAVVDVESRFGNIVADTASRALELTGESLTWSGSVMADSSIWSASDTMRLSAGNNMQLHGVEIDAGKGLSLEAGNDIGLYATSVSHDLDGNRQNIWLSEYRRYYSDNHLKSGGALDIAAGKVFDSHNTEISAVGDLTLRAGTSIWLSTERDSHDQMRRQEEIGLSEDASGIVADPTPYKISSLSAILLQAGDFISTRGAVLTAARSIALVAQSVYLNAAQSSLRQSVTFLEDVAVSRSVEHVQQTSLTSGENIHIQAEDNVALDAAQLIGAQDITIDAGRGLNLYNTSSRNEYWITLSPEKPGRTAEERLAALGVSMPVADSHLSIPALAADCKWCRYEVSLDSPTDTILSADNLHLTSGGSLFASGVNLTARSGVMLKAAENLDIEGVETYSTLLDDRTDFQIRYGTRWQGNSITAGNALALSAGKTLALTNTLLHSAGELAIIAGEDIGLYTTTDSLETNPYQPSTEEQHILSESGMLLSSDGNMQLTAGGDITTRAAGLASLGNLLLSAGRSIFLATQQTEHNKESYGENHSQREDRVVRQVESELASQGDMTLRADGDITLQAASLNAGGDMTLTAAGNLALTTATDSDYYFFEETLVDKGFLSKEVRHRVDEDYTTREKGARVNGAGLWLSAGKDLTVTGSSLIGEKDVSLWAEGNSVITAATEEWSSYRLDEKKESGLLSGGFLGFTIGSRSSKHKVNEKDITQSQSISTLGSSGENVYLDAGGQVIVTGADIVAAGSLMVSGDSVHIVAGQDMHQRDERLEQKTSGLTLALSGAAATAITSTVSMLTRIQKAGDSRLSALIALQSALTGVQSAQGLALGMLAENGSAAGLFGLNLSLGMQRSVSEWHESSVRINSATLTSGEDTVINAYGSAEAGSGDILIAGSQLKAGGDIELRAENDLHLTAAANIYNSNSRHSNSGGSIGVGIGASQDSIGLNVSAGANASGGHEGGNATEWHESQVTSGNTLWMFSGRDMALTGALTSGNTVNLEAGRHLELTSLLDSERYRMTQYGISGGLSVAIIGVGWSGSLTAEQSKIRSDYDSVREQTGVYAGEGGFRIQTTGHTQLNGAVIASRATEDKNSLETGTLGWQDEENSAKYSSEQQSAGVSNDGASASGSAHGGSAYGLTRAAVSGGSIVLTNPAGQGQDPATLNRDVENANGTISPIFNKEKEQRRLAQAKLIGEIGGQVMDITRKQVDLNGLIKAKEQYPDLTADALRKTDIYKTETQKYGTGSTLQRAIQAATAGLQGLMNGNPGQAISGAAAPWLAEQIHKLTEGDPAAKAMAHAVVGAVTAWASGNSAQAGAIGAVSGEVIAQLVTERLYPNRDVSDLSEAEKQTASLLATLAAGLAGGVAGNSTADAIAGALAGKNAAENNYLSSSEARQLDKEMQACKASGGDCNKVVEKYIDISNKNSLELIEACTGGGVACITWQELIQGATNVANDAHPSQVRLDEKLKDPSAAALVNYLNGTDLKFLQDNITTGDRVLDVVTSPSSWPVLIMGGKALVTNTVTNGKELLIAAGASATGSVVIQYGIHGEVKLSDVIGAGVIGAITAGKGYNPTVTWNAAGGYYQAELKGDDPFLGAFLSKAGAATGYAAGNILKVPADKIFNPVSKQYEWIPTGVWTITKPAPQHSLPSILGNAGNAFASGGFTEEMDEALKSKEVGQ
ncbi:filamentous hemagglutinin family protein [Enterobacter sp. BIGb0383]|uniref:hemagglutinin repeat-containing protein n=1 Tax=unclassified Enterobacter TaxID=2608935 RepID=UPI000F4A2F93|nr:MULTISPECIES: hemagglutinin repeat-containing protein [unclassified Enterobacter]ROP60022.1 filamentous hemagglutinin family protein [Enterobacter sp. BIGb0383]ROS08510.1 filamentous hemagglutinin family protein [Enterobacter sp. BIGb0359]